MSRFLARTSTLLLILSLAAACGGDSGPATSDVFGRAPWPNSESHVYVVKDAKGALLGRTTLTIAVSGATTQVGQSFRSETNRDDSTVTVNTADFKPVSAKRVVDTPSADETIEVSYTDEGALIKQGERQSGLTVPEHAYDNDTSLFLWRTLPFAEGYEAAYTTIITNRRTRQKVTLRVVARETVRVTAGEFAAWRLEIRTSNARQTAWYADTPQRPLLRYDNDRNVIFELERLAP